MSHTTTIPSRTRIQSTIFVPLLMVQVESLEATKAALAAKGVTPNVDITAIAPLGIKVMFVNDPEGNPIEIVEVTDS